MLCFDNLHGKSKNCIESKVTFILQYDASFTKWFNTKFMKYGGFSDEHDMIALEESVIHALNKLLN